MQKTVEEQVGAEALVEWLEHPMTAWLAATMRDRADVAKSNRGEVYYAGEPNKTQEIMCYLNGSRDELEEWYDALNVAANPDEAHPLNSMTVEESDE